MIWNKFALGPQMQLFREETRNLSDHLSPDFRKSGDIVTVVGEWRPLSKSERFNVLKVSKGQWSKKRFIKL